MNEPLTRGPALTIFLVLLAVVSIFGSVVNLIGLVRSPAVGQHLLATYPAWGIYTLAAIGFLRLLSVIAIWMWSRSGVILYIALTAMAIPICSAMGMRISIVGIGGVVLLLFLVRNKWHQMPWGFLASKAFDPIGPIGPAA